MTTKQTISMEVAKVLEYLAAEYQNFQVSQEKASIWAEHLAGYSLKQIKEAIDRWIRTSGSPYPPQLPQLIQLIEAHSKTRPELQVITGKAREIPGIPEEVMTQLLGELAAHVDWIYEQKAAGTLNKDEELCRRNVIKDAYQLAKTHYRKNPSAY